VTKIATDKQIRALSDEAAQHGDDMQLLVCYRALHADFDYDDYSDGGHRLTRANEKRLRAMTQEEARLLCTAAINPSKREVADQIAQDAGTKFVQSIEDASWATKSALPMRQAEDIKRRLNKARIEASLAPDNDDRSVAWVYATLDEA
jgi:hypothetical protein